MRRNSMETVTRPQDHPGDPGAVKLQHYTLHKHATPSTAFHYCKWDMPYAFQLFYVILRDAFVKSARFFFSSCRCSKV